MIADTESRHLNFDELEELRNRLFLTLEEEQKGGGNVPYNI